MELLGLILQLVMAKKATVPTNWSPRVRYRFEC
jgi:hypothetical protein